MARELRTLHVALLLSVAVLIVFTGMYWKGNRTLVHDIEAQIASLDSRMTQLTSQPASRAAAPPPEPAADPAPVQFRHAQVKTEGAPTQGPAQAPVTVAEFSDFQCIHCGTVRPTLIRIRQVYGDKVRIVWKHNPLPMHKDAPLAHLASLAAQEQGKFWEYHDKLFSDPDKLKREHLVQYARELGLDLKRFEEALDTRRHQAQLDRDLAEAASFQLTAAPAFLINARALIGAHSYETLSRTINAELEQLDIPVPTETP